MTIGGGTINIGDSHTAVPFTPIGVTLYDINAVVKDKNGNVFADRDVVCQLDDGTEEVFRTDANGQVLGIKKK